MWPLAHQADVHPSQDRALTWLALLMRPRNGETALRAAHLLLVHDERQAGLLDVGAEGRLQRVQRMYPRAQRE